MLAHLKTKQPCWTMLDKLDENKSSSEHKQQMMSVEVEGNILWKTLHKQMSQTRIARSMTSSKTRDDIILSKGHCRL